MRLSNLADYAVITMCQAALHCGNGRVSAAELAAETGLPVPTVQKLVSKLTAAGLPGVIVSRGQLQTLLDGFGGQAVQLGITCLQLRHIVLQRRVRRDRVVALALRLTVSYPQARVQPRQ